MCEASDGVAGRPGAAGSARSAVAEPARAAAATTGDPGGRARPAGSAVADEQSAGSAGLPHAVDGAAGGAVAGNWPGWRGEAAA